MSRCCVLRSAVALVLASSSLQSAAGYATNWVSGAREPLASAAPPAATYQQQPQPKLFESRELRSQLDAIREARMPIGAIESSQRKEIEAYAENLVLHQGSPVPLNEVVRQLPGSTWRLSFSTNPGTLENLPKGSSSVYLNFVDNHLMDHVVQFEKGAMGSWLGKNSLRTRSSWFFGQGSLLCAEIDRTEAKRLVGGMHCPTAYFDGDVWIERGGAMGYIYSNIFLRENN